MKNYLLFLTVPLLLLSGCRNDEPITVSDTTSNRSDKTTLHCISEDEALNNLYNFMADEAQADSRSAKRKVVISIEPVKYSIVQSRADANINCENLLYVANFDDNQGYAILAADDRIPETVIAVSDSGSLSAKSFNAILQPTFTNRVIVPRFPLTGPGFFTVPETGDEVYMNPNTVDLHDENEDDTLVGNFDLDEDEITSRAANETGPSTPETVSTMLCVEYAATQVASSGHGPVNFTPDPGNNRDGDGSGYVDPHHTETSYSSWTIKKRVSPLLYFATSWGQTTYFNNFTPKRRKYLLFGNKQHAPAGCFPLAIAKVMATFEHPNPYKYQYNTVNWHALKWSLSSNEGILSAATLAAGIGNGCDCLYFYNGTFTFPHKAVAFMKRIGFRDVGYRSYSFDRIAERINTGRPVIIYAMPNINIFASHCWNIDGYKIKSRTKTTKVYNGTELESTKTEEEIVKMVHCDFGWKGLCNGYYISGVFDLNSPSNEYDSSHKGNTKYDTLLTILTYVQPSSGSN